MTSFPYCLIWVILKLSLHYFTLVFLCLNLFFSYALVFFQSFMMPSKLLMVFFVQLFLILLVLSCLIGLGLRLLLQSLGSIGVWLASYAAAAFISSVSQSSSLIAQLLDQPSPLSLPHLPLVLSSLFSSAGHSDWSSLESIDVPLQQRHLSRVIDSFRFDSLMASSLTPRFKALALSSSLPHAGEWLNATPFPSLGLSFHDWEFRVCL